MAVATVLYEDKMQVGSGGAFPPHDFVLAMVADLTGRTVWDLRPLVDKNPRNGVSKLIGDLKRTGLLAGSGKLCVLVDRDRVAEHLGLPRSASESVVTAALYDRSDAPDKDHNSRDLYLNRAAFALAAAVRDCVRGKQPSLGALAVLLAELCRGAA